jgi:hypothetical protein
MVFGSSNGFGDEPEFGGLPPCKKKQDVVGFVRLNDGN